jgi:glutamate dehydrogenase (NAD(P)+)
MILGQMIRDYDLVDRVLVASFHDDIMQVLADNFPDLYLNAGGVTVSYFEWLKNLSHVNFGRLEKRFQEMQARQLINGVEKMTGRSMDAKEKKILIQGGGEIDYVRSGLEETMIYAYNEIRDIKKANKKIEDLRTAAFVSGINKLGVAYQSLGIFP